MSYVMQIMVGLEPETLTLYKLGASMLETLKKDGVGKVIELDFVKYANID